MTAQPLHRQLDKLIEAQKAAYQKHEQAKYRLQRLYHEKARETLSDLSKLSDDVTFHRPGAPNVDERPEAERSLSVQFAEQVIADSDIVLRPIPKSDHLTIFDLSVDREHKLANYDFLACRRARLDFEEANADGLKAEVDAAEMQKIKRALAGDSPEELRKVLAGTV